MRIDWSFPRQIFIALIVVTGLGVYPLLQAKSEGAITAAIVGALLATLNVLAGYATTEYSFGKSMTTFFAFVIGGMGVRLMFTAALLILLIKVFQLHVVALIASMGVCYVVFLVLEISFIHKKLSIRQQAE
jgi:hypothetical protein